LKGNQKVIKVVIMGMENAGKTTIVDVLTEKIKETPTTPPNMIPTRDVARTPLEQKNTVIWDFGGQELFRNTYISNPESYLRSISLVYYVVDVQDIYRHQSSVMYFMAVFQKIIRFSPDAELCFIFHKMDPKFDEEQKELKLKFLKAVEPFLQEKNLEFTHYDTSIFNLEGIKIAFNRVV
jgi:small GTP-binding protein